VAWRLLRQCVHTAGRLSLTNDSESPSMYQVVCEAQGRSQLASIAAAESSAPAAEPAAEADSELAAAAEPIASGEAEEGSEGTLVGAQLAGNSCVVDGDGVNCNARTTALAPQGCERSSRDDTTVITMHRGDGNADTVDGESASAAVSGSPQRCTFRGSKDAGSEGPHAAGVRNHASASSDRPYTAAPAEGQELARIQRRVSAVEEANAETNLKLDRILMLISPRAAADAAEIQRAQERRSYVSGEGSGADARRPRPAQNRWKSVNIAAVTTVYADSATVTTQLRQSLIVKNARTDVLHHNVKHNQQWLSHKMGKRPRLVLYTSISVCVAVPHKT